MIEYINLETPICVNSNHKRKENLQYVEQQITAGQKNHRKVN